MGLKKCNKVVMVKLRKVIKENRDDGGVAGSGTCCGVGGDNYGVCSDVVMMVQKKCYK